MDSPGYDIEKLIENELLGIDPDFDDPVDDQPSTEPFRYKITSYGTDLEVEILVKRLESNVYMIPDYQRGYVWTQTRASQFIESLILGLPVPGIFLYRNVDRTFLVIDGHQRLKSLQGFYAKQFPGSQRLFTLKNVDERFKDRTIEDLADEDRRALDSSVIHATVIEQEQPDETEKSSIYHIFKRINSGSVPLTPHEIRYCVSYGRFAKSIKSWNEHSSWRKLIGPINPRMKDQELILRFFAMYFNRASYEPSMQSFLDTFLEAHRDENVIHGVNVEALFRETSDKIFAVYGSSAFRLATAVNTAIAESLLVAFAVGLSDGTLRPDDELRSALTNLKQDAAYKDAISRATARPDNVDVRLKKAIAAINLQNEQESPDSAA